MPPAAVGSVGSDAACGAGRVSRNKTLLFFAPRPNRIRISGWREPRKFRLSRT
jgi:hypothetical protein